MNFYNYLISVSSYDKTVKYLFRFNDGEFVDDCEIDPSSLSGELSITTGYEIQDAENTAVGTYSCHINETTGFTEVTLSPEAQEGICYYLIRTGEGKYLRTTEPIPVATVFKYLSVLEPDLSRVTIEYYDSAKSKLYEGSFDTTNLKLLKKQEGQ